MLDVSLGFCELCKPVKKAKLTFRQICVDYLFVGGKNLM